jgi:hypothetical protein
MPAVTVKNYYRLFSFLSYVIRGSTFTKNMIASIISRLAPVAQRIERWPPEPDARVRVPSGVVIMYRGGFIWVRF